MSFTTAAHSHHSTWSPWPHLRRLAPLALVIVGALALTVAGSRATSRTGNATDALTSAAAKSPAVSPGTAQLPAPYRTMPPAKLAALGIVRNPRTGQWMCVRVASNIASSSRTSPIAFRP
jgi:hypothetical protein